MPRRLRNEIWWLSAILLLTLVVRLSPLRAAPLVLHLKNGDRLTGNLVSENTNSVSIATPYLGTVQVPLGEISRRDQLPETPAVTVPVKAPGVSTNAPPAAATNAPPAAPAPVVQKAPAAKPPLTPANPEATSIASTPKYWKHDLRFGLNTRYATKDSQEILLSAKSTYGKPPFRHILDASFRYGEIEGVLSANSVTGSEKTEYQLSPKTYLFGLVGGE